TRGEQLVLVVPAAAPDGADGVDDVPRRQPAGGRRLRVAGVATAELAALGEDRGPAGTMDRAADAEQRAVRGVDDRVGRVLRDVALGERDPLHALLRRRAGLPELDRDDGVAVPAPAVAVALAERLLDQRLEVLGAEVRAAVIGPDVDVALVGDLRNRRSHAVQASAAHGCSLEPPLEDGTRWAVALLAELHAAGRLDWERAIADSSHLRDGGGIPLAWTLTGGNLPSGRSELPDAEERLDLRDRVGRGAPGRERVRPEHARRRARPAVAHEPARASARAGVGAVRHLRARVPGQGEARADLRLHPQPEEARRLRQGLAARDAGGDHGPRRPPRLQSRHRREVLDVRPLDLPADARVGRSGDG